MIRKNRTKIKKNDLLSVVFQGENIELKLMCLPLSFLFGKWVRYKTRPRPHSLFFGGRFENPSVFVGVGKGPVSREHFIVERMKIRFGPAAFPLLVFMVPSTYTSMRCYLLAASRSRCSNILSDIITSLE